MKPEDSTDRKLLSTIIIGNLFALFMFIAALVTKDGILAAMAVVLSGAVVVAIHL